MITITLTHGYYIESDKRGYFLKQKYHGKSKDGASKECIKKHGYFGNVETAVEKYIALIQNQHTDEAEMTLKEYAEEIKEANKNAVWAISKIIREGKHEKRESD